jgi:DNA-binding NarL/FixJ family response regulator
LSPVLGRTQQGPPSGPNSGGSRRPVSAQILPFWLFQSIQTPLVVFSTHAFNGLYPSVQPGETLANYLHSHSVIGLHINQKESKQSFANQQRGNAMLDLSDIKITRRDEQVLHLLVEGCSNKEIAEQLNISPRTVKQHLRTLFLRAGIKDGRKRVKLATAVFQREQRELCNHVIG